MERRIILFLAAAVLAIACSGPRQASAPAASQPPVQEAAVAKPVQLGGSAERDSLFLSIDRTPCFGTCKAYRIELYRSGFATYEGLKNMEKEGKHTAFIGPDTLELILAKSEAMGFFGMNDVYDAQVTDLPSTYLRIVAKKMDRRVMGRVGQPAAFKELVAYIEELLLPVAWKPVVPKP